MTKKKEPTPEDIEIIEDEETAARKPFGKSDSKLRDELDQANKEKKEYLAGWQRAQADLANVRKDAFEAEKKVFPRALTTILTDLLPVLDSFDLAFGNKEAWESAPKNWRDGVTYIHQQFLSVLSGYGVSVIDPVDEEFNPQVHESIEAIPVAEENKDGKILSVMQKGYRMGETIIRPARVKVGMYETH